MRERLRRNGKRIVALMLAVIMVLAGLRIGGTTAKAADATVTITGLHQAVQQADGHWRVWLKVDGTLPDGAYSKPSVEVNGSAYTGGLQMLKDKNFLLIVFWNHTETLREGTSFGIKAGVVTHSGGNLTIANDYTVEYKNGAWGEAGQQIDPGTNITITSVKQQSYENGWFIWLGTEETLPAGSFEGLTIEGEGYTSYEILKDGNWLLVVLWGYSQTPAEGAMITLKAGTGTNANGNITIAKDYTIRHTGTEWTLGKAQEPEKPEELEGITFDGIKQMQFHPDGGGHWRVWLKVSGELPSGAIDGIVTELNGSAYTGALTALNDDGFLLLVFWNYNNQTPANGTTITVKAGTGSITIAKDFTIEYYFGQWFETGEVDKGTELVFTKLYTTEFKDNSWRMYLNTSETLPNGDFTGIKAEVDGEAYTGALAAMNIDGRMLLVFWGLQDATPDEGMTVTIKEGVATNPNGNITILEDFVMKYVEGAWTVQEKPTVYTDIQFTGFTKDTALNGSIWNTYIKTNATLPSDSWATIDGVQERFMLNVEIDGTPLVVQAKKSSAQVAYLHIPAGSLPADKECTVTVKAGQYKSNVQNIGWSVTEDFTFYTSLQGWSVKEETSISGISFTLNPNHANGKTADGFVLNTDKDDSLVVDGWSTRIYPAYEKGTTTDGTTLYFAGDNGVKKNGVLQQTDVSLIKLAEHSYYVALSDRNLQASAGDEYTVGGVFYENNSGGMLEFHPITVKWTGSEWETIGTGLIDSGVLHDINADGELKLSDLMRVKSYLKNPITPVNMAQLDVNFSQKADAEDASSLRKVLVGAIYYDEDGMVYGIPEYKHAPVFEAFSLRDTLDVAVDESASSEISTRLESASVKGASTRIDCMKDADGFDVYLITNVAESNTAISATVTLKFEDTVKVLVYNEGVPEILDAKGGHCEVTVGVGEGVFVIPIAGVIATNEFEACDFIVDVPGDREAVVLQISDTQIMDAAQRRYEDRLPDVAKTYWATDKMDERCFDYLREMVREINPDLILLAGDIVFTEFDDQGTTIKKLAEVMDSFEVPWAPVMGNHDGESVLGIDYVCDVIEASEYGLFVQRNLCGNGNYSVGIRQNGKLTRVFFMMDSNGYSTMSDATKANGHSINTEGFGPKQIAWYTDAIQEIHRFSPETKISFTFHIPLAAFGDALVQYGYTGVDEQINIYTHPDRKEGDFGFVGYAVGGWDSDRTIYNGLKELGVDSFFVGHQHCISASVVYDGIRFQFGQKSSAYDALNFLEESTGTIVETAHNENLTPLVGGTVMPLSTDGTIVNPYIYLCEDAGGSYDWETYLNEN